MTMIQARNALFATLLLVAMAMFFTFATPGHSTAPGVDYQFPCRVSKSVQACVVVDKTIAPKAQMKNIAFDVAAAKPMVGQVMSFSVIYRVRAPKGLTNTIAFQRGSEYMISDITDQDTLFWMTTRDGGFTWSRMQTTDMNSVTAGNM